MYILLDLLVIVGMSVAIARACVAYCRDIGIPFAWAMRVTGDEYDGDVLEITKSVKILFAEFREAHLVPHGYGVYTFACGTEYDGGWKEGKMCRVHGKMTFVEKHVYDGEWADGLPNGHGTFTWAVGSVFMGEFKNGLPDGQVCPFGFSPLDFSTLAFFPVILSPLDHAPSVVSCGIPPVFILCAHCVLTVCVLVV